LGRTAGHHDRRPRFLPRAELTPQPFSPMRGMRC
jgi:hypothetical protein